MVQWANVTQIHKMEFASWNRDTGAKIDPRLSVFDQREDVTVVKLPYFGDEEHEGVIERAIPTITVQTVGWSCKSNYCIWPYSC